jgi:hypothetical protein
VRRAARHPGTWICIGIVVALALRAPWLGTALGRDEGGDLLVARAWHHSSPFPYGPFFLDRPPLLLLLYKAAATPAGVRVLGAIAAAGLVAVSTLLAVRLAGRRAAPFAALTSALMASSFWLKSVFTPAELIAVVPSAASVLLVLRTLERPRGSLWALAAAGALGASALLVKQSFYDALAAGGVTLVAAAIVTKAPRRIRLARIGAYVLGAAAVGAALVVWAQLTHPPAGSVYYAMFGFRLDAAHTLAKGEVFTRMGRLLLPAIASGLAVLLVLALGGIARLRERPIVQTAMLVWLIAAGAGVVLGGSYWAHYLIALVPIAAAGAAAFLVRFRIAGPLAAAALLVPLTVVAVVSDADRHTDVWERATLATADYMHDRALPGQTFYALYAHVNAVYYSGLRDPFPYNWSLMMRAAPRAQARLRKLLASPQRPTWILEAQSPRTFGLDRNGTTKRLLATHYRVAGQVCGRRILLARGAPARPAPPDARACSVPPNSEPRPI